MKRPKVLVVIAEKCKGCLSCEVACSSRIGEYNPSKARLYVIRDEFVGLNRPMICNRCGLCVEACLRKAIYIHPETKAILINEEKCNDCGACITACPLSLIKLDSETGKAVKCDLCDGEPLCVKHCPYGALLFGNPSTIVEGRRNKILLKDREEFIKKQKLAKLIKDKYPYLQEPRYPTL